jgi:hypothetical protein
MLNDPVDELVVQVRADTGGFMAGVADMQRTLDGPFAGGLERAGLGLSRSLGRALSDGKLGFDELRVIALRALGEIGQGALRMDLGSLFGGGAARPLAGFLGGLFGLPGRATGGPVAAGRPYLVGERGPEVFVPTAAGRVEANGGGGRAPIQLTVNVAAPREASAQAMRQTGAQVARAVARTLDRVRP